MSAWIDFKALRASLGFEQVLRHYGVEIKHRGDQHQGFCPLPNHNGKKNSPSFSANLVKGIFQCFGCGAKGNILDFAVLMERLDPKNGADLRQVAIKLQERFNVGLSNPKKRQETKPAEVEPPAPGLPVVVNAPLDFELKRLDASHPYFERRGLEPEIIARFGLGFCAKGMLAGRIAIPVHSLNGELLGYCGRLADDKMIGPEEPKYKFPPKREHKGTVYEFHKSLVVYNAQRIPSPVDRLTVVEGFPSVWWITQMGFANVVALMGSSCSPEQAEIVERLVTPDGHVWIVPDGDEAGERFAASSLMEISPFRFVKQLKLDEGKQPTDYPGVFFREGLN